MDKIFDISNINSIPKDSYAVLGSPIAHSMSPQLFKHITKSDNYCRVFIQPEELEDAISILNDRLCGYNVTIPFKSKITKYIDIHDATAKLYGTVNTVKVFDGKTYGYSTDGIGFRNALKQRNILLDNSSVLILGAGGVSRVMAYECAKANCDITIVARNNDKASILITEVKSVFSNTEIRYERNINEYNRYDLLLNGTPVGMFPSIDFMPIAEENFAQFGAIYDTVYNPNPTKLIKCATNRGIIASSGLNMLVLQAIESVKIWQNKNYECNVDEIINLLAKEMKSK